MTGESELPTVREIYSRKEEQMVVYPFHGFQIDIVE